MSPSGWTPAAPAVSSSRSPGGTRRLRAGAAAARRAVPGGAAGTASTAPGPGCTPTRARLVRGAPALAGVPAGRVRAGCGAAHLLHTTACRCTLGVRSTGRRPAGQLLGPGATRESRVTYRRLIGWPSTATRVSPTPSSMTLPPLRHVDFGNLGGGRRRPTSRSRRCRCNGTFPDYLARSDDESLSPPTVYAGPGPHRPIPPAVAGRKIDSLTLCSRLQACARKLPKGSCAGHALVTPLDPDPGWQHLSDPWVNYYFALGFRSPTTVADWRFAARLSVVSHLHKDH